MRCKTRCADGPDRGRCGLVVRHQWLARESAAKEAEIIVINNGGGNIFRRLKGPEETGLLEAHFEAGFATDVSASAQQLGLKYACAQDWESLEVVSAAWLNNDAPGLLEIQTPGAASAEFLASKLTAISEAIKRIQTPE